MSSNADSLVAKAEKKASSSGGWFSSSSKHEEAADLFQQAANAYKVEKKWRESGMAFEKWVIDSPFSVLSRCRVKGT
jgi:alpha-soluble NSF attachment protein